MRQFFEGEKIVKLKCCALILLMTTITSNVAMAQDETLRRELFPTGKLRIGIAVALVPGTGNVAIGPDGKPRGAGADAGNALAAKLGVEAEFVPYPNSGALTDAAPSGAWDVAFLPVDEERRKKVDSGPPHIVLQSTYLVGPGSKITALADVDRQGVRVAGVENTATARGAARTLKNVTLSHVKTADELFELLRTGQVDAIALSRDALINLSAKLPGSRVLDGAFFNSFIAVAVPKDRPAALAYVSAFIVGAKRDGTIQRILDQNGLQAMVAAP